MTEEWTKTGEKFTDTSYSDTLKKVNSMTNHNEEFQRKPFNIADCIEDLCLVYSLRIVKDNQNYTVIASSLRTDEAFVSKDMFLGHALWKIANYRTGNESRPNLKPHPHAEMIAEQKSKIVSSLTDEEIANIYFERHSGIEIDVLLRYLVNAAAQRAIEELFIPDPDWFIALPFDTINGMHVVLAYIKSVKEGKL